MSAIGELPLSWSHRIEDGLPTLAVKGTLTMASGELLYDATVGLLRQHRAEVLIDLSAMTATGKDTVVVFTRIMTEALRWPDVLVVVAAPTVEMMQLLGSSMVDPRLLFDSVDAGRSAAAVSAPAVSEDFLPISGAARRARDVVTDACLRWDEPDLVGAAALVASELVTNAAMHAHTMMTMQVRLRPCHVRVAVFDGSATPAVTRRPGPAGASGRGLHLVDAVSTDWGSTPLRSGKVVWSALSRDSR